MPRVDAVGKDQVVAGVALVVALVALASYYAWRQLRWLRRTRGEDDPSPEEGLYRRAQAKRRLVNSVLMLVLAAQLAGALLYLEGPAKRQADRAVAREAAREAARAAGREAGGEAQPTAEERSFAGLYSAYWLLLLVNLLAVVVLALADLWATRRFLIQAYRQLQTERRDMIDREVARLRQERQQRNGHN
jgi:hypothetical protein